MAKQKTIKVEDLNETHRVLIDNGFHQVLEAEYSASTSITTVYFVTKAKTLKCMYILTPTVKVLV